MGEQTFPIISATLLRMKQRDSTQVWDAAYADYLMHWYIRTGGRFVPVADFFHILCALVTLPQATPASGSQCAASQPRLFLQAAAVALEHCPLPDETLQAEHVLEKALENVRYLVLTDCRCSGQVIAHFFGSALHSHHASTHTSDSRSSSAFLASRVLAELCHALGAACVEDVQRSLDGGASKASICETIEQKLLQVTS